ncbi:hypothetical protein [Pseudomonas aeruginosa]|uniref:hypothetical protein n=1 Tax=Pseudomonas aeruginosa TaxID=287 RepID=UPI001FF5116C|nr:hypothetical protein [Pseudomonas aeruginosa]MCX5485024.1 hypothetical protein [Pseudomonas aeruginosa]MCX5491443.1 hypothetical protein [Pseudomonas aeruginosa]HCW0551777.1 hypothetical protein [Pseudomonas aeruginosa]HCW0559413.1 hypothetical protein [Pseudomonas aeruginosa]HCW0948235.1 hypothetical protein [Pseudomonas aeruginosa]
MSSSRLIDVIAANSTKKIQEVLDEAELSLTPELMSADSLKQAILEDPFIELTTVSKGCFKAFTNNGSVFKEATLRDFYCGQIRVKAQHQTLRSLKAGKIAPPWDLTTAYYCAFFSAIELLRLYGLFQISLDSSEHESLLIKLQGNAGLLEDSQNFTGRISACGEEIIFTSNGQKPHQSVWKNTHEVITRPLSLKYPDWKEVHTLNLIMCGTNNWSRPSDIRNNWNYKKTEFYSELGQPLTSEFYSLIENTQSACLWLERSMSKPPTEKMLASSIAVVCEIFSSSVISAYENLVPSSEAKKRAHRQHKSRSERRRARGKKRKQRA